MPWPPAIRRQDFLSLSVAWNRRGYQARGAAMLRPSANSTDSVSLLISTCVASGVGLSAVKELIPCLQEVPLVSLHQIADSVDLLPTEPMAAFDLDRVEPELRLAVVALNVNVRRLVAVAGVEEKPKRSAAVHRGNPPMLP